MVRRGVYTDQNSELIVDLAWEVLGLHHFCVNDPRTTSIDADENKVFNNVETELKY